MNTLLAAMVASDAAVVWTRPDDLAVDAEGEFAEQLNWQQGKTSAVMVDAQPRIIRDSTPLEAWRDAACIDDGRPMALAFD